MTVTFQIFSYTELYGLVIKKSPRTMQMHNFINMLNSFSPKLPKIDISMVTVVVGLMIILAMLLFLAMAAVLMTVTFSGPTKLRRFFSIFNVIPMLNISKKNK